MAVITLVLAGTIFFLSVSPAGAIRGGSTGFFVLITLPSIAYWTCLVLEVQRPWAYRSLLLLALAFSIGVLVPELSDSYATQVLAGMEEFLIEEGYFYLTASHRRKPDLIEEYPRLLMERSVEGFIVIDTILEESLSLPVVVVAGHRKIKGVTNVVLDQKRAAELALRHLYQLGREYDRRWREYVDALKANGLSREPPRKSSSMNFK